MQDCGPSGSARLLRRPCGRNGQAGTTKHKNRQGVDHMKRIVLGLLAATALAVPAFAADVKPAIIYDLGGKFDKSFNEVGLQRRREVQDRDRHRLSRFRDPERRPARAGAAQVRRGRQQPDRHGRLLLGRGARKGRGRVPRHQVRHHRHGRRQAERALGRLQGAGRLLSSSACWRRWPPSPRRSASSAAWTSR